MKHIIIFIAAIFQVTNSSAQVNRCTMPDGKIVYSDAACPAAAADSKTLIKVTPRSTPTDNSSAKKIEFTDTPRTDYIKAGAILDNIRMLGRDCEWAIKVDKKQTYKCSEFLSRLGPKGELSQVTGHISKLNEDKKNAEQNSGELSRILRHMEEIVRYKEFVLASFGNK